MRLGIIGLGKMGGNMARRICAAGIETVGHNRDPSVVEALVRECALLPASSAEDLVSKLEPPRSVWLMLPAGEVTQGYVDELGDLLDAGDLLVDGANSYYRDSMRRAESLAARNIRFVDAGVSGGIWGLENGYALMLGGEDEAIAMLKPVIEALAPGPHRGWVHAGPAGSGHFAKMVHNGIEYGMMQAYAEGFSLLEGHPDFELDLAGIGECWRHGSVVRSWLLDLLVDALGEDQLLDDVEPRVADSGEGRWTALEGIEQGVPTPVMSLALMTRFATQGRQDYAAKLLSVLRGRFGGHAVGQKARSGK